jgi:hypothetical protein
MTGKRKVYSLPEEQKVSRSMHLISTLGAMAVKQTAFA